MLIHIVKQRMIGIIVIKPSPTVISPWIHVLVDGSEQVTYVAQSNLIADETDEDVNHPLLNYFFTQI